MIYKCPLCGSSLTEHHYHKVIKLQEKKEEVQKGELERIKKQAAVAKEAAAAARKREQDIRVKAKQNVEIAKKQAAALERSKSAIRDKRLMARIQKLEEEKRCSRNTPLLRR